MATFPASERIKSKRILDELYAKGKTLKKFPFVLKYMPYAFDKGANLQIVVTVPKRKIRSAVKRNRLKRQIKEAYRHQKINLLSKFKAKNKGLALFLIYVGKGDEDYHQLDKKLTLLLKKLEENI